MIVHMIKTDDDVNKKRQQIEEKRNAKSLKILLYWEFFFVFSFCEIACIYVLIFRSTWVDHMWANFIKWKNIFLNHFYSRLRLDVSTRLSSYYFFSAVKLMINFIKEVKNNFIVEISNVQTQLPRARKIYGKMMMTLSETSISNIFSILIRMKWITPNYFITASLFFLELVFPCRAVQSEVDFT